MKKLALVSLLTCVTACFQGNVSTLHASSKQSESSDEVSRMDLIKSYYSDKNTLDNIVGASNDLLIQSPLGGFFANNTLEEFKSYLDQKLPNRTAKILDIIAEDDQSYAAVLRDVTYTEGISSYTFTGIDWFEFNEDGQVTRYYHYLDTFALPHKKACGEPLAAEGFEVSFPEHSFLSENVDLAAKDAVDAYYQYVNEEHWSEFSKLFASHVSFRIPMDKFGAIRKF